MTKKDYELIASVLKQHNGIAHTEQAQRMMESITIGLSIALQNDNPRFDKIKFLQACGLAE